MRLIAYLFLLPVWMFFWFAPLSAFALDKGATNELWVVSGDLSGAYDIAITSFRHELAMLQPATTVRVMTPEQALRLERDHVSIIVTFGLQAAGDIGAAAEHITVINALLPSYGFNSLHNHRSPAERARISAVFIDQPVFRQIRLIREALPKQSEVAIIASDSSSILADNLADEAIRQGLSVRRLDIPNKDSLYDALQSTLSGRAALIALPDRSLFNAETVQNILLTSFRMQSAVIGFSAAYVRAGALISVHTTPEQVGMEAAFLVNATLSEHALPPPRFPELFEVGVNPTVARSLGIPLDAPASIERQLRQLEGLQP